MFKKILVADRGDKRGEAALAAKAHVGAADVMPQPQRLVRAALAAPQPHRLASEASGDRAAGA